MNPWLILAAIGLMGVSFGAGYYSGWQGRQAAYERSVSESAKDSRIGNEKVNKGYGAASKEIRKIPVGDCVGPRTGGAADWLRTHYSE